MADRVSLRAPTARDREAFLRAVRASRDLHRPWSSPPRTDAAYAEFLRRSRSPTVDTSLVCRRDDGAIVGMFSLSQIVYGPFRNAYLGYDAFEPYAGHGYMREGLRLVVRRAFGELGLHRLQANVQPGNTASIALVAGAGFRREGFSPRYLKIGGRWRDHESWALLADGPRRRPVG